MLTKGSSFAALAIIGAFVAVPSVSPAAFTEDFSSLASDPDWQNPDNGWQFLSDTLGNGSVNNSIEGDVFTGGPGGKYGNFAPAGNNNAAFNANPDAISGTFSFLAMIESNASVDEVSQLRFWLGGTPGAGDGNDQRPMLYLNKSSTAGKLRLQLNRGGGNGYVNSLTDMNLDQWYRYTISYDLNADVWDLVVTDLSNATVFSEPGSYDPNVLSINNYSYATWERRYGSDIGGNVYTGPALEWNIDQINLPIPEPTSAAVMAGIGCVSLLRRKRIAR